MIFDHINFIHKNAKVYMTNFYTWKESIEKWITWGQLEIALSEKAFFLLRRGKFYTQVYYFADGTESVISGLRELTTIKDALNVEFLGKVDTMRESFEQARLKYYISFDKMTKISQFGEDSAMSYGEFAKRDDAGKICDILVDSMDSEADQIPEMCEIIDYIEKQNAIVLRSEDGRDIISCILWTRMGRGMIWKYWALNPSYKGTVYSMKLLDDFLNLNGSVNRSTLFVRIGNPAVIIYKKIGFNYDGVKNYVYCYRKKDIEDE